MVALHGYTAVTACLHRQMSSRVVASLTALAAGCIGSPVAPWHLAANSVCFGRVPRADSSDVVLITCFEFTRCMQDVCIEFTADTVQLVEQRAQTRPVG